MIVNVFYLQQRNNPKYRNTVKITIVVTKTILVANFHKRLRQILNRQRKKIINDVYKMWLKNRVQFVYSLRELLAS
jgi:Mg2+ and Co2+ transporter CorA